MNKEISILLDGDLGTSMKAAAAEAFQKWMASTLGVKP